MVHGLRTGSQDDGKHISAQGKGKLILFMDWDETISSHDTLALIAPPQGQQKRGPSFSTYGEAYMRDLQTYDKEWRYDDDDEKESKEDEEKEIKVRNDLGKAWRKEWQYLKGLDAVELLSQQRIEQGGLFYDADFTTLAQKAVQKVKLRKGWKEFVQERLQNHSHQQQQQQQQKTVEWHVISVGWSAYFIKLALSQVGEGQAFVPRSICANEVQLNVETKRGTGLLTKSLDAGASVGRYGIRTAAHKVREMRRIVQERCQKTSSITMYFGDSSTDLGCLVEANLGIVMGQKQSIRTTIQRAGLSRYFIEWKQDDPLACQHILQLVRLQVGKALVQDDVQGPNPTPFMVAVNDWIEASQIVATVQSELQ